MRSASPLVPFSPRLGPSSPPHTPTAPSSPPFFAPKISSGHGSGLEGFSPPIPPASLSQPLNTLPFTTGHKNYSYPCRAQAIPPYSSHASDADVSEQEPELSDDNSRSGSPSPLSAQQHGSDDDSVSHAQVTNRAEFSVEELSDFEEDAMQGRTDIIYPTAIEDAESERPIDGPLDRHIIRDLQNLKCRSPDAGLSDDSGNSDLDEEAHEALIKSRRERERRHRMSKSSGTKRTISDRDDSSDHEDVCGYIGFDEVGSSDRRLRKKIAGDRRSFIFPDPPPKIDEMVEPEELEKTLAKELPFYEYTSMEVDSPRSP